MFKIVKLNKRSIAALCQIDLESDHEGNKKEGLLSKAFLKKQLIKRFEKGHELFFGYKEKNELKGYATLKLFFPGHKHCELYWLAVKKKYQNKGIGTKLLQFIADQARGHGFRKLFIYTGKTMKKTRVFYEKNGYLFLNEFPGYYGYKKQDTTAVLYCKKI